jgi:glutathione synthase
VDGVFRVGEVAKDQLTIAFVMDPVESEDFDGSTTIVLMLEAQRRGHEVLYVDPYDLLVIGGRPAARVTPVTLTHEVRKGGRVERGTRRLAILDEEIDIVFQRKDPPVDADFVTATQILELCQKCIVLNRPTSIIAYNEKLLALHYRDLMPETMVTRHIGELRSFMDSLGGEMIVKPLDGKGGEGIFHLRTDDRNLNSTVVQSTLFESRWVMAQQFLAAVRLGDKRILLLDGEVLGAVLRIPADSEVRANLHIGGRAAEAALDDDDHRIVERVGPDLKRAGLFFVGIDVIGGRLTEINVTSPTGVQEINRLQGVQLEEQVIGRAESLAQARD